MGRSSFASCRNFFNFCTFPPTARLQVSFFSLFPGKLKQVQVEGGEKEERSVFSYFLKDTSQLVIRKIMVLKLGK